ncbi:hypothetical protein CALVIDRAFT_108714 [Calocera viscosa TUFC12733]|uniref:Uncharacterized protein n=1 Tax=Calocera viscosa (strain TUFC12733) TaxID=1330018 RepID=A0A167MDT0_CALVF|nr:hypothetical protein CALVIDRAFT_108714 [Calocera viscosa TUFC12733]
MTVETRSRARALRAARSASPLHFASQAQADAYLILKEIKELKRLRTTRLKRLTLKRLHACYEALQSPVYKLPDEILRMIFIFAFTNLPGTRPMHYAITLTHVARRWRVVALSIPMLWTHIPVHPRLPLGALLSRIEAFAKRASPVFVNVVLELSNLFDELHETDIRAVADVLCRKVYPRCERLTIMGHFVWDSNAQIMAPGLFTFELCPHLRVLTIADMEFTRSRSPKLLLSLQSCTALEELTLAKCDFWVDKNERTYALSSLRRLTSLGASSVRIVAHLDLPKVESWTFGDHDYDHMEHAVTELLEDDERLASTIRKHLPALHRVTVTGQPCLINMETLARFLLKLLPLDTITCEDIFFTGRLTLSESKPNSTALLPRAEIAKLDFTRCHGVSAFLDTLFSRSRPHSILCKIHARSCSHLTPENKRRLQEHAVDVEWTTNPSRKLTPIVLVPISP